MAQEAREYEKEYKVHPAMSVITQDCFIRQATIRANEHTQRIFISKSTLGVRNQNDSFINSEQCLNPIFH